MKCLDAAKLTAAPVERPRVEDGDTKVCPFCAETIKAAAIRCKHCGAMLNVVRPSDATTGESGTRGTDFKRLQLIGTVMMVSGVYVVFRLVMALTGNVEVLEKLRIPYQLNILALVAFVAGMIVFMIGRIGEAYKKK